MFFQPVCAVIQDDDKHTKINLFLSVAICFFSDFITSTIKFYGFFNRVIV